MKKKNKYLDIRYKHMEDYVNIQKEKWNVTPLPPPGQLMGARHYVELGLFNLYLLFSQKKHLHLHYKYDHSRIHLLYTESHYFSIYKTYTYSKNTEIVEAVRLALISELACSADVGCPVLYPCLLLLYLYGLKTRAKLYA